MPVPTASKILPHMQRVGTVFVHSIMGFSEFTVSEFNTICIFHAEQFHSTFNVKWKQCDCRKVCVRIISGDDGFCGPVALHCPLLGSCDFSLFWYYLLSQWAECLRIVAAPKILEFTMKNLFQIRNRPSIHLHLSHLVKSVSSSDWCLMSYVQKIIASDIMAVVDSRQLNANAHVHLQTDRTTHSQVSSYSPSLSGFSSSCAFSPFA